MNRHAIMHFATLPVLLALCACGAEVATTAATGAAIKAREAEQAQNTRERVEQKIDDAAKQMQQSASQAADPK